MILVVSYLYSQVRHELIYYSMLAHHQAEAPWGPPLARSFTYLAMMLEHGSHSNESDAWDIICEYIQCRGYDSDEMKSVRESMHRLKKTDRMPNKVSDGGPQR